VLITTHEKKTFKRSPEGDCKKRRWPCHRRPASNVFGKDLPRLSVQYLERNRASPPGHQTTADINHRGHQARTSSPSVHRQQQDVAPGPVRLLNFRDAPNRPAVPRGDRGLSRSVGSARRNTKPLGLCNVRNVMPARGDVVRTRHPLAGLPKWGDGISDRRT